MRSSANRFRSMHDSGFLTLLAASANSSVREAKLFARDTSSGGGSTACFATSSTPSSERWCATYCQKHVA
uniref:Uncharacterized protein n=1 Tax=Arundo donax TaxID=35708 RepID=A0A0A8YL74_ARUDO